MVIKDIMIELFDNYSHRHIHILQTLKQAIHNTKKFAKSYMQNQQNIQKLFFQQLKPGQYVDAKFGDDDWKLAKVIDRESKCISIIYDGCSANNQQVYINPLRVKPLRALTIAYTGPPKGVYMSLPPIPDLSRHISMFQTILKSLSTEPPSAYQLTQYLRGQLFASVNGLLMSDIKLSVEEIKIVNGFFMEFVELVCRICGKVKEYLSEYFQANSNNKYLYLINYKLAIVHSLQQLSYLLTQLTTQTPQPPKLLKVHTNPQPQTYKTELLQQNYINQLKKHLPLLVQLCKANDGNGRWLPTYTRLCLSKILLRYREQDKFLGIVYDVKDYLQFYGYWPGVMGMCPTQQNQKKFVEYILLVMNKQSPFDAKLKSLIMLRKLLQKQQKLNFLAPPTIIQLLNKKNTVNSLLLYFNPQIFKRYIPILKLTSQQNKKTLTQAQIDDLFKIMKTSHESDVTLIYQIIVSISQFINVETLDNIYTDIQKNIDINSQNGVRFVREFTVKAIQNFNNNKNKGLLGVLIGRKKCSGKYGYYGLDLLCREIQDGGGRVLGRNVGFVIRNIGVIFENQVFQHERYNYMQNCISNIEKRQSYGQSIKLLHEIICTYPSSTYISQSQQSVLGKLDQKFKLIDTLIKGLKPLQKQISGTGSKNINVALIKVDFNQSIKYFYDFIQRFSPYFKYKLQLRHINHLWHMPNIFQFLRKSKQSLQQQIPAWKRKYYKKLPLQLIKSILTEILKVQENMIPSEECFDAIHELILSLNLNKSLELTQRATVRYINLDNVIGIGFYYKFLDKMISITKSQPKNPPSEPKTNQLLLKIIKTIFQLHLRPQAHQQIDIKSQNWLRCLMKVVKSVHRHNPQLCLSSIQSFLELIKGRQYKQISATGKIDIVISYQCKEKTITLAKNSTILKMRQVIMDAFRVRWNFQMFNTALKRDITFVEEEDFSVNAMGHAIKGPTIIVKKVQEGQLYPQTQAYNTFMLMLQKQQQFYQILFGLLKHPSTTPLHPRIWKTIQKLPVNLTIKNKIKNCQQFTKQDWLSLLLPTRMQQLQYSINIIYTLLGTTRWMEDFRRSEGVAVVEELYLSLLASDQGGSGKVKVQLSKIVLRLLEYGFGQDRKVVVMEDSEIGKKNQQQYNFDNLDKITKKIMQTLQVMIKDHQNTIQSQQQKPTHNSIQLLNLMLKILLVSSHKRHKPPPEVLARYFITQGILLKISQIILFEPKSNDTTFFTEDILERIALQNNFEKLEEKGEGEGNKQKGNQGRLQIFKQFINKYLNVGMLASKKSTENYFIFLIDFLHGMSKQQASKLYENNPQIVKHIKTYIEDSIGLTKLQSKPQKDEPFINEQMIHGCLKLLNETLTHPTFQYQFQKIFKCLLQNFVLSQNNNNSIKNPVSIIKTQQHQTQPQSQIQVQVKPIKSSKTKYKKILYDIMKTMIFSNTDLLDIFVGNVAPRLQNAEWRRNLYSSWNLEQQKKEKKFYCGLENLAATCYINCLFQQLFMIKRFTDRFINIDSISYKQSPQTNQIYQLQKLLTYLQHGNKRSYTTKQFCQSFITYQGVSIDPTVQNDADQFFNALMEKIQTFLKLSGHHYILQDTFQGRLSNQLNCEGCPHSSEKIQTFLSIGLNIKNKKTLQAAFDGYVQGQILDGDNAYFCQKCQKKVRTMKRMCIKQVPNILVVVLKRFSYNYDQMRKIKINDQLKFPQDLNIKKYTSQYNLGQDCKPDQYYDYKLRGVVIHAGTSQGGHYYSFIKEQSNQNRNQGQGQKQNLNGNPKWYEFNDQIIEEADYKRIQQDGFGGEEKDSEFRSEKYKNAYILFYEKVNKIQKNVSCGSQKCIEKVQEGQMSLSQGQAFQSQLSDIVKSQNRNSQFLSIILDQLFIRLCENIAMCGNQKAHYFIMLYFHTVLIRDKNKQEQHLANIYRIILTLINSEPEVGTKRFALWFIQQVDDNYIKEFLIQAPKLVRYLCLGLVKQAIKVIHQHETFLEEVKLSKKYQVQSKENSQSEPKSLQQNQNQNNQEKEKQLDEFRQTIKNNDKSMQRLICCLISKVKAKGMTPFAKIFSYLSTIPKYKAMLQSHNYPQRVAEKIVDSIPKSIMKELSYESVQSYFGKENSLSKEKDLETSYTFLIQSLRAFPGVLPAQNILSLLNQSTSRPSNKSLSFLLAKSTVTAQQALQNIQSFQLRLMDWKYKREDIQKYLFLIRYYYILAAKQQKHLQNNKSTKDTASKLEFIQSIVNYALSQKKICINSLTTVIKTNEMSYQLMELTIIQLNKLAYVCSQFRSAWLQKVGNNDGLAKAIQYWVSESNRPHFLQKAEEWKKKTANLTYNQKEQLIKQNKTAQQQRTRWMFPKKPQKSKSESPSEQPVTQAQKQDTQNEAPHARIPQIHSQLQLTQINKNITVGFKTFRICERLGILTKVQDDRNVHRWAILEKNDVETYLDF